MGEYYCTNCNSDLNEQSGFDPDMGTWTCTNCGMHLYGDDIYEGVFYSEVMWYCDECNDLLNKQDGFYDYCGSWQCTNCYHINSINEDNIQSTEDELGLLGTVVKAFVKGAVDGISEALSTRSDECDADDYYDENEVGNNNTLASEIESDRIAEAKKAKVRELHKKRFMAFVFKKKRIPINYSSLDLIGKDVNEVISLLENVGFNNIIIESIKDVYVDNIISFRKVSEINLHGITKFKAEDMVKYDEAITIKFHEKRDLSMPFSSKEMRKLDYKCVLHALVECGFTNARPIPLNNIVLGIIKKNGVVNKIEVGGIDKFPKDKIFVYDTEIKIFYNSFN